jgi:hypothetical protein
MAESRRNTDGRQIGKRGKSALDEMKMDDVAIEEVVRRARICICKLRNYLGRIIKDIERNCLEPDTMQIEPLEVMEKYLFFQLKKR